MPTAENGKLEFEAGQTSYAMSALTDSGDNTTFTSSASIFSNATGKSPDIRPNGVITGGAVSVAASGSNDVVDVAALTCYLAGVNTSVSAGTDLAITRAVSTDTHMINSITVTSAGALAVVTGTDGTAFVDTRGAAGGPPYIPTGSIEIAQVRTTSFTAAPITASEIFQVSNVHLERYDEVLWNVDYVNGEVDFVGALRAIHTGDVVKEVYASYASPIFTEQQNAADVVLPENSHSVSSTQVYNNTLGSTSKTLNQGSFTAYLNDGITDPLVKQKDDTLWFRFYPDRYKSPYSLAQGVLGITRSFPAGDNIQASCTISAESEATDVEA